MSDYNKLYTHNPNIFGIHPSEEVCEILTYKQNGTVLDIGAGNGRNSIYLSKNGFDVTAIENSQVAISHLKKTALDKNLSIKVINNNISNWNIPGTFDIVIGSLIFHHLPYNDAVPRLHELQKSTSNLGIHVLNIITTDSDFYLQMKDKELYYPNRKQLVSLYQDWNIIYEKKSTWKAAKDTSSINTSIKIIFEKK